MHQALYRKWRPLTFDSVSGQEHITSVLRYEVEHSELSHAYLFCGSRGTGKTTCAKILAKAANCLHPINGNPCCECEACRMIANETTTDIVEMDAASNNSVDDVRNIRDEVVYTPSALKYRVYIIDEVHMLSASAFNALLKTLEEPPAHVIFILATTELQKLPATIISRCQRFEFRRISIEYLTQRLLYIAEQEKIEVDPEAARSIARYAQGGMRDAISLLELCSGTKKRITAPLVDESVGSTGRDSMIETVAAIASRDYGRIFAEIDTAVKSARDISVFWQDLISLYRDLLLVKTVENPKQYLDLTESESERLAKLAGSFTRETIMSHVKLMNEALYSMQKAGSIKRIIAETTLIRMCDERLSVSDEALLSRIAKLEDALASLKRNGITVKPAENTVPQSQPEVPAENTPHDADEKKIEETPKPETAQRILRPVRGWSDIMVDVCQKNGMVGSFFTTAKAYTDGNGKYIIRFDDKTMPEMIKRFNGMELLADSICGVTDTAVTAADIVDEVVTGTEKSLIDEIILENE